MTELKFRNKGSIIFLKGNIKKEEVKLQTRHMYKNGMAPAKIKKNERKYEGISCCLDTVERP